jgi:hypothetical protein
MIFPEDPTVRELVKRHGATIRDLVAEELDYDPADVAVIPEIIRDEDKELLVNPLALELVIQTGTRPLGKTEQHATKLVAEIKKLDGFEDLDFGVWLQPMVGSAFAGQNTA